MPFGSHHGRALRIRVLGAAALIASLLVVVAGGCAKNSSCDWAQTAPVIKEDATANGHVGLGALSSNE